MANFLINIKRVYDPPNEDDGFRILIDRLWSRGMSKQKAELDLWIKEVAPTNELRQWFSHEPDKWKEFKEKYRRELSKKQNLLNQVRQLEKDKGTITLIYSARDTAHSNAVVLKETLERKKHAVSHVVA